MTAAQLAIGGGSALLGLLVGLGLGKAGGRKPAQAPAPATSGPPPERSPSDKALMRGLSHFMADDPDRAIEELTKAVNLNSDTVETYMLLGNLFRQKGEIDRAVYIRQTILARRHLSKAVHMQAMFDLGLDYKAGGLFNRAAEALGKALEDDPKHVPALRELVLLHERTRDWEAAYQALRRLDKLTATDSRHILAHYKAEAGKDLMAAGKLEQAEQAFSQAISVHKNCLDAYLHYGDLELSKGRHRKALSLWRKAVAPVLAEVDTTSATASTLLALARRQRDQGNRDEAMRLLDMAIERNPEDLSVHKLRGRILLEDGQMQACVSAFEQILDHIKEQGSCYRCSHCGIEAQQLTWQCHRCFHWDSLEPISV